MRIIYSFAFSILFITSHLKAQLITTQTLTPQQLVQNILLGSGVTASNITYTGDPTQIAQFMATTSSSLGVPLGVYISTGNASTGSPSGPQGPNNSSSNGTDMFGAGDSQLDIVSGVTTFDAAILEFDFIPTGDSIKFRYCFGSEEYPEFVNAGVNDAFAFFLSGPNPAGGTFVNKNVALLPGTTTAVSIDNVNPGLNASYYRSNAGNMINSQFDGFTTVLYALEKIVCGQTYHIKIAIADGGDGIYDSGVFLEGGSFSSSPPLNVYTVNSNSNIPDSILVEDCNTYCAYFIRNGNIANVDSFNLQVTGNAILGTDYIQLGNATFTWPTTLVFAANQDTIKICNINALQDGLIEGTDTLKFTMSSFATSSVSCLSSNSIKFNLYLKDYTPISIGQNDFSLCSGTSATLNAAASNGYPIYTYSISSPAVTTATLNTGLINAPTTFTIIVNDVCNKPVTKQIVVTPVATPTVVVTSSIVCVGNPAIISATGAGTYSWSTGALSDSITVYPTSTINYTVVGSIGTCTNAAVATVTTIGQAISITGNTNICIGQSSVLTASGGSSYTWDNGATTTSIFITPTINTSYTVSSVSASCTNIAIYSISVSPIPTVSISGSAICPGQNDIITATGATTYTWNTGATTNNISVNSSGSTTYTVTGTTVASCTNTAVYTITVIPTPTVSVTNAFICGGDSAVLSASGASSYIWTTGSSSSSITVSPVSTTNYTVIGSVGSCTSSAVATVSVMSQAISITGNNNICIGQSSVLSASGGAAYTWDTGTTTFSIVVTPTTSTTYSVLSVLLSCTNSAVFTVSVTAIPTISVSGTPVCPGQNAVVTATGATTYIWNTGATGSIINVNPIVNTTYTVIGMVAPSCTNSAQYTVNVITSKPILETINPVIFCLDSTKKISVTISNGNSPYALTWLIPSNGIIPYDTLNTTYYFTQSVTPSNANYTIIVTDQCLFKDTIYVNIETIDCNIIVPNVVTPNGDNVNEYFKVNGLDNFPGSSLLVFNRWGNKVYSSDDYKNDWKPNVTSGTYFYLINVADGRKFNGFFQVFKD